MSITTIGTIPNPGKEVKKVKPNAPSIDEPSPADNDFEEDEEFELDEGILNAREPSKIPEETFENPERILG